MCPSLGQRVCWQGFAGGVLMAEGGGTLLERAVHAAGGHWQYKAPSTCHKAGKGSGVFRDISLSPVQLQEDLVGQGRGLQPAPSSAPHPALGKGVPG